MISRFRSDQKCILAVAVVVVMTVFIALVNMSSLVFLEHTAEKAAADQIEAVRSMARIPTEAQAEELSREFASRVEPVLDQAKRLLLITTSVTVGLAALIALLTARSLRNTPDPMLDASSARAGDGSP